ncbi:MAG: hypothetical protein H0V69_14080 [Acidimicrobiia bacterium]|nr:hypothetical protein [Acidimicrobiia bacterium]
MARLRTAAFVVVCALTVAACVGGSDNEDDGAEAGQGTAITDVASTTSDAPVTAAPTTGVATATQPPTSDAPTTAAPTTLAQPTTTLDPVLEAISDGYVARCNDGGLSDNTDFGATCSGGDGIDEWLAPFGECEDGTIIAMSEDASCSDHDGFRTLLEPDYKPTPRSSDIAKCQSGVYSDNVDIAATCSSNGGVDEWLAAYGKCEDGTVIVMSKDASCSGHGEFRKLLRPDYKPTRRAADVARCKNGLFSDNTDFAATCSSNGGVDKWLATYGKCLDGTVIKINADASCSGSGGFDKILPKDYQPPTTTTVPATTLPPTTTLPGFDDGTKLVNQDIPPGRYITKSSCYWERLSGLGGTIDDIIANDNSTQQAIVEIYPGDAAFNSIGCGRWELYRPPAAPATSFGPGDWVVNEQFVAGTYQADGGQGGACYWERAAGFDHLIDFVIANDFGNPSPIVEISPSDVRFSSSGCGTWTKIG